MSVFYTAYFVKTEAADAKLNARFSRVDVLPESAWAVCNFSRQYSDEAFEPGTYFTKELSEQFGEIIFIGMDTQNDQLDYEHSKAGVILRKLSWLSDGSESTWAWVEGEIEGWEETAIFSEANFERTRELVKYDDHLALLPADELLAQAQELRGIWENREYRLEGKLPWGDATLGMVIQQYFGLRLPE